MNDKLNESNLDELVGNAVKKKYIYGVVFYVSSGDNNIDLIKQPLPNSTTLGFVDTGRR